MALQSNTRVLYMCPTNRLLFLDVCTEFTCTSVVTVGGKACGINPLQQMAADSSGKLDTRRLYLPFKANVSTWKHWPAHALRGRTDALWAPGHTYYNSSFQSFCVSLCVTQTAKYKIMSHFVSLCTCFPSLCSNLATIFSCLTLLLMQIFQSQKV